MKDFTFDGHTPSDFGRSIHVGSRDIGFPSKKKTTDSVAFNSHVYDFSLVYGSQVYGERKIKYVIHTFDDRNLNVTRAHELKTKLINWLMTPSTKIPLYDDATPGYHFLAEVQDENSFSYDKYLGELTVTFTCYAFMVRDVAEGQMDWNHFKLPSDIFQDIGFTVDGSLDFLLINPSATAVVSTVTVTGGPFATTINGANTTLKAGDNRLSLPQGKCRFSVTGTGTLHFDWHREVI